VEELKSEESQEGGAKNLMDYEEEVGVIEYID